MTEKSRLQEYCQKNKLSMPNYEFKSKGPPHKLEWDAKVTIKIKGEDVVAESIVSTNSKASAEKQAAAIMLDMMKSKLKPNSIESRLLKLKKNNNKTNNKSLSSDNSSDASPKLSPKKSSEKFQKKSSASSLPKPLNYLESDTVNNNLVRKAGYTRSDLLSDSFEKCLSSSIDDLEVIIIGSESDDQKNHSNDSEDNLIRRETDNTESFDCKYNKQSKKSSHNPSDYAPDPNINLELITDIYLIDLENKPAFNLEANPNRLYIGFLSSIHHAIPKYNRWHKGKSDNILHEITKSNNLKLLYTIDSSTTDVVDHFITVFCYPVINFIQQHNLKVTPCGINSGSGTTEVSSRPKITIRIISGDHAAYCTRDCLIKIIKWRGIDGVKIKNAGYIHQG